MIIKKPIPGSRQQPAKDSKVWSQIIDVVNAYQSGRLTKKPVAGSEGFSLKGIAYKEMSRGDVAATVDQGGSLDGNLTHPVVMLEEVEWHKNLSNVVIVQDPAVVVGQAVPISTSTWTIVNLSASVSDDDKKSLRYVMPDPAEPLKLKAAGSGMYEIVFFLDDDRAVVNTTRSQPFWRYQLTGSWNSDKEAEAKLLDVNDIDFTGDKRATITDVYGFMDDQSSGDTGVCFQSGNKFHALQAIC